MLSFLKIVTVLLVMLPEFRLDWHMQDKHDLIKASLEGFDSQLQACAASGLSPKLRYEFQLCKSRKMWFDQCDKIRTAVSSMEYDPISETYLISQDFHGDIELPVTERVDKLSKAISKLTQIQNLKLDWIAPEAEQLLDLERYDLRGRVIVECRGNYSESVKRLSSVLSLGLIENSEFDSDWVKFSK